MEVDNKQETFYTTEFIEYPSSMKKEGNFVNVDEIKEERLDSFPVLSLQDENTEQDNLTNTNYEKKEISENGNSIKR